MTCVRTVGRVSANPVEAMQDIAKLFWRAGIDPCRGSRAAAVCRVSPLAGSRDGARLRERP